MQRVCVFCGSRSGTDPAYLAAAKDLGHEIASRGLGLVYGGAKIGLMGAVADAALAAGGEVIGYIPRGLVTKEIAHDKLTEQHVVDSMHERKDLMIERSDAFVSLPGGFGTYDELFEALTLGQIGFHSKPSGLLNVNGYFDPLIALVKHTIDQSFASAHHLDLLIAESTSKALLDRLATFTPPELGNKWA